MKKIALIFCMVFLMVSCSTKEYNYTITFRTDVDSVIHNVTLKDGETKKFGKAYVDVESNLIDGTAENTYSIIFIGPYGNTKTVYYSKQPITIIKVEKK